MVTHDPRAAERASALLHLEKGVLVEAAAAGRRPERSRREVPAACSSRNLTRKKVRTVLTIGSFAVAMFLFGILAAVRARRSARAWTSRAPSAWP